MSSVRERQTLARIAKRAHLFRNKVVFEIDRYGGKIFHASDPGLPMKKLLLIDEEEFRKGTPSFETVLSYGAASLEEAPRRKKQKKAAPLPVETDWVDMDIEDNTSVGGEADVEVPAAIKKRVHRQKNFQSFWDKNKVHLVDLYLKSLAGGPPSPLEITPRSVECGCAVKRTVPIKVFFLHGKYTHILIADFY